MQSSKEEIKTIIGTEMGGGFYAGRILIDGKPYALIVAPKGEGEHEDTELLGDGVGSNVARSPNDGLANTKQLAAEGSELAQWAIDLRIAGHDDWYLPSQDELEIIYRNLKPTTRENWIYNRSGMNLSAIEPTRPYTDIFPLQTTAELFKDGAAQAFDGVWYWSSSLVGSGYAWVQAFGVGTQSIWGISSYYRARAVRRLAI